MMRWYTDGSTCYHCGVNLGSAGWREWMHRPVAAPRSPFDLEFMLAHRRRCVEIVSSRHPLADEAIARHVDELSWTHLSDNERLAWSPTLLRAHGRRWYRRGVCVTLRRLAERQHDPGLLRLLSELTPWSAAWAQADWHGNREHVEARLGAEDYMLQHVWFWPADVAEWIPGLLARFPAEARREHWRSLCWNSLFPWTTELLDAHEDELCWETLSHDRGFPWSLELLRRHEQRWCWTTVLQQPWASETEERFETLLRIAGDRVSWPELAQGISWTAGRFDRYRERVEEATKDRDGPEYWTFSPTRRDSDPIPWAPDFVDRLVELEAQTGRPAIDWEALCARGGPELWTPAFFERYRGSLRIEPMLGNPEVFGLLDPHAIEPFLDACALAPERARHPALEARIVADPEDPQAYDEMAAWLDDRGDPQARPIQLMRGVERGTVAPADAETAAVDYARRLGFERELSWRRGFVRKAAWFRRFEAIEWRGLLGLRPFALVEELRIADGFHQGLGNFDRAHIDDEDWALLAGLPCLAKLALHHVHLEPVSTRHELRHLTHLDLIESETVDLSLLSNLPAVRSVALSGDPFYLHGDLGGLAQAPGLRELALVLWNEGADLARLRGCEQLETLWIGHGDFDIDLRPIADLHQLRRLILPGGLDRDRGEGLEAVRLARPDLEITSHGAPWMLRDSMGPPSAGERWFAAPDGFY